MVEIEEIQAYLEEKLSGKVGQPTVLRRRDYSPGKWRRSFPSFKTQVSLGVISKDPRIEDLSSATANLFNKEKRFVNIPVGGRYFQTFDYLFTKPWTEVRGSISVNGGLDVLSIVVSDYEGHQMSKGLAEARNAREYKESLIPFSRIPPLRSRDRRRTSIELFVGSEVPEFFKSPKAEPPLMPKPGFVFEGIPINPRYFEVLRALGHKDLVPEDFRRAYEAFREMVAAEA